MVTLVTGPANAAKEVWRVLDFTLLTILTNFSFFILLGWRSIFSVGKILFQLKLFRWPPNRQNRRKTSL